MVDRRSRSIIRRVTLLVPAVLLASACTDTKIVEVERPFFTDPPAQAAGFLGYDEEVPKLTVCGNCHIGQQSGWVGTAHARAWTDLQNSSDAQEACQVCHTVSEKGNATSAAGGWVTTQDSRFHDVQCENCHGPGATHVANPDASQPLASLAVNPVEPSGGLIAAQANTDGCGECHGGAHEAIVETWSESPHAEVVESPAGNAACQQCHRGQQILEAWGENADYKEKNSPEHLAITCGVCHDPHSNANPGQLRFPVTTPAIEEHLCARCHNRRTAPSNAAHGLSPHAPESALLIGDAGWFPPNANIDQGQILGTHGTDRNPKLCATCHLPKLPVSDPLRPGVTIEATSHLFRPIPCIDAEGKPLPFGQDCDLAPPARSYKSCVAGGCHGTEQAAFSALTAATTRIQRAADELLSLLEQVDPGLEAPGGEIDDTNPTFTVAEGAFFNYNLATFGNAEFGTNTVVGSSVHNPFLTEALLIASIQAVEEEYGVQASLRVDWNAELRQAVQSSVR